MRCLIILPLLTLCASRRHRKVRGHAAYQLMTETQAPWSGRRRCNSFTTSKECPPSRCSWRNSACQAPTPAPTPPPAIVSGNIIVSGAGNSRSNGVYVRDGTTQGGREVWCKVGDGDFKIQWSTYSKAWVIDYVRGWPPYKAEGRHDLTVPIDAVWTKYQPNGLPPNPSVRASNAKAVCSVTDGSGASSSYPCACGTASCATNELCTSSSNQCQATCAAYPCPSGYVRTNTASTNFSQSNCCQASTPAPPAKVPTKEPTSPATDARLPMPPIQHSSKPKLALTATSTTPKRTPEPTAICKADETSCPRWGSAGKCGFDRFTRQHCETTCHVQLGCQLASTPAPPTKVLTIEPTSPATDAGMPVPTTFKRTPEPTESTLGSWRPWVFCLLPMLVIMVAVTYLCYWLHAKKEAPPTTLEAADDARLTTQEALAGVAPTILEAPDGAALTTLEAPDGVALTTLDGAPLTTWEASIYREVADNYAAPEYDFEFKAAVKHFLEQVIKESNSEPNDTQEIEERAKEVYMLLQENILQLQFDMMLHRCATKEKAMLRVMYQAQAVWTMNDLIANDHSIANIKIDGVGREICFLMGWAIRQNKRELIKALMPVAKSLNLFCCPSRGLMPEFTHQEERVRWPVGWLLKRGGGFNKNFRDFFIEGKSYRTAGWLACAHPDDSPYYQFMKRAAEAGYEPITWTIRIDSVEKCYHVNYITVSIVRDDLAKPAEKEYLFAPFSAFKITRVAWKTAPTLQNPHEIDLDAYPDNRTAPPDLPVAPWQ